MAINLAGNFGIPPLERAAWQKLPETMAEALTMNLTEARPDVVPTLNRWTEKSEKVSDITRTVYAAHCFKVPILEKGLNTKRIYKLLEPKVKATQEQAPRTWFEENFELVIQSQSEVAQGTYQDVKALRRDWKRLLKRVAHKVADYDMAKRYQLASLINILVWMRLNEPAPFSVIATDLRWPVVNKLCKAISDDPSPKGFIQRLISVACPAVAYDNSGALIISNPIFDTSIFGNLGQHAQMPSDMMAYYSGDGDAQNSWQLLQHTMKSGLTGIEALINHMSSIFNQYGSQVTGANPFDYPRPSFPFIENGPTVMAVMTDTESSRSIKLNSDECMYPLPVRDPVSGSMISSDNNLTTRLWASYHFWTDYINKVHPEMGDNGKWDKLLKQDLGLFVDTPTVKSIMHAVTANKNIDAIDLIRKMKYKRDMQVNTSTIIKAAPFIYSTDATVDDWFKDDAVFNQNFERYAVDSDSGEDLIESMKEWPTITPSCFTSKDFVGNVYVNTTHRLSPKQLASTMPEQAEHRAYITESIFGESSSNFDFALTCPVSPDDSTITFNGLTEDSVKSIISQGDTTRGFMFTEVPDMVWAAEQPLLDTTDIFCTGFFLMMAAGCPQKKKSNWHIWFEDKHNYIRNDQSRADDFALPEIIGDKAMESIPDIVTDKTKWTKQHVANDNYLSKQKECFIFLGTGIFDKPQVAQSSLMNGYLFCDEDYTSASVVSAVKKIAAVQADSDPFLAMIHNMIVNAAKGAPSQPVNNNAAFSLFESIRNGGDIIELNYFMFDPSYGPVELNFYGTGYSDVNQKLPLIVDPWMTKTEEDSVAALSPKAALFDRSTEPSQDAITSAMTLFDKNSNGEFQKKMVLPFLTALSYPGVVVDPTIGRIGVKDDAIQAYYCGDAFWWLHVCGRVKNSFVDSSKTRSVWDIGVSDYVSPDVKLAGANEFLTKDEMSEAMNINPKADPGAETIKGEHAQENIRSNVQSTGDRNGEEGNSNSKALRDRRPHHNRRRGGHRGRQSATNPTNRSDQRESHIKEQKDDSKAMINPTGSGDESTPAQDKMMRDNINHYDPKKGPEA